MCEVKKQIDEYIDELQHTVIVAGLNYDIWWIYREKRSREKFEDIMNHYLEFFATSIHAHFVALLAALYRIYETRPDTINVPRLFELLSAEGVLSEADIAEVRQLYETAKPLWVKVSVLRNEQFMHRANRLDGEEGAFKKAKIRGNDFKRLVEISMELLNKITHKRSRSTHAFNLTATHDTVRLLSDLNTLKART